MTRAVVPAQAAAQQPLADFPLVKGAYFIASDAMTSEQLLTPAKLAGVFGAETVNTWEAVQRFDTTEAPLELLLIHPSALKMVDKAWLMRAYQNGVILVFFDTYAPEIADLLETPCLEQKGFASEPYGGPFFVSVYKYVLGDPQDVALLNTNQSCTGGSVSGVDGRAVSGVGAASDSLMDDRAFVAFTRVLKGQVISLRNARSGFESTR